MPERSSINLISARTPAQTGAGGKVDDRQSVAGRIGRAKTLQAIANAMQALLRARGFTHALYGGRFRLASGEVRQIILSGYPKGWIAHYLAQGYASIDPVIEAAYRQPTPVVWHADLFDSPARRILWQEAGEAGMQHGITVPVAAGSNEVALLSAAGSTRPDASLPTDDDSVAHLYLVAAHVHQAVRQLVEPATVVASAAVLSARERECLAGWLTGKTADAIAEQLAVSTRTVRFHLGNAKEKLGARNRTEALSKALAMGLVRP